METRFLIRKDAPELYKWLVALDRSIAESGLSKTLFELIKIRVSQINKCGYCLDIHTKDALEHGEAPRRIFALNAWKESPLFTEQEKAVLQLSEEVTLIHKQGLTDETYHLVQQYFDNTTIAKLVMAVISINALNRSAISSLMQLEQ